MNMVQALEAVSRLEALSKCFGAPDQDLHREFVRLVFALRMGPLQDDNFLDKIASLTDWADIGFSTRKFERYRGGAPQITAFALGDCFTLRWLIEERWTGQ